MKKIKQLLIVLTLALVAMPIVVSASPPSIPLLVYGNVTIDGQFASIGTEISAEIDGREVASTIVTAEGKYFIGIPDGKINEGKIIVFEINGIANDSNQHESVNINTIPSIRFDLAIATLSEPEPEPSPAPTGGGGGGGGYIPPIVPTTTKVGDANGDNKVNKYDFALLMSNWGETGSNICDLNGDSKVDKYDFSLLMSNWGL